MALAQQYVPDAQMVEDVGREAVINLPHAASEDGRLALFLNELDKRQGEFGVVSYGLSDTTLEEVSQFRIASMLSSSPIYTYRKRI